MQNSRSGHSSAPLRLLLVWGPALALMLLIFATSSSPDPGPVPGFVPDKVLHFGVYGVLGMLILRGLADGRLARVTWRRAILAVALATIYGISDEFHQSFVPGRTPEVRDVVADTVGATTGAAFLVLANALRVRLERPPRAASR